MKPIDERRNIENQVRDSLCLAIGRGQYRPGEALPAPADLARELLVNPHKIEDAYRMLLADGVVTIADGNTHIVQPDAPARARTLLTDELRQELTSRLDDLRTAGCDALMLEAMVKAVLAAEQHRQP